MLENLISHEESTTELDSVLEMVVKKKDRMPNTQLGTDVSSIMNCLKYCQRIGLS